MSEKSFPFMNLLSFDSDYYFKFEPSESVNFIEKSKFRHREVLGPEAFQSLTEKMDARQKNTFRLLGIKGSFNNYVDIDFPLFDHLCI